MKKIIVAGLLAASMVFASSGVASAGTIKDCVATKAHTQLSAGQAALVDAYGDNKINVLSVIRDKGLGLSDIARVNFFVWSAGTACVLGK